MKLTVAQRTEQARKRACPLCHCEAGRKCRKASGFGSGFTGGPMKSIHAERLALIPKEVPDGD